MSLTRILTTALVGLAPAALAAQSVQAGRIRDLDSLTWRAAGPGVEMALIDGNPQSTGDFTFAMRFKAGGMIPPHFHPNETRVLVVRGEVRVGFSDVADTAHARVIGPGGYAAIPAEAHHFEAGKTDALIFLTGPGPLKTTMVGGGASTGHGEEPVISRGGFVVRLGRDTISAERFTRTRTRLEGEIVRRSPTTSRIRYAMDLNPDGTIASAKASLVRPNGTTVRDYAPTVAAGSYLMLPESYGPYEAWLARLRGTRADTATIAMLAPMGGPQGNMPVRMFADSARAMIFGAPLRLRVDDAGRLLSLDGTQTTLKYEVTRVADVDITALTASFAARDSAGSAMGLWISKRDTVNARVGDATVWIDYGRPLTRGRPVFTNGVLGDTLWRTGANAATQFRTDKDLLIGGKRLAAGTYTVWTRVSPDNSSYAVVFNSQTGQWGTEHHGERDLLAVPLEFSSGAATEAFTISVENGSLVLAWGTTRLAVAVSEGR